MPASTTPVQRDHRRAESVASIKAAALARLAADGAQGLSLRAVARDVGVSVQALYHYFDSRDALLTALITDTYASLADAVDGAARTGRTGRERAVRAGLAYRAWAVEHPGAFLLALGAPLPGYAAPVDGPTTAAAQRMGAAFQHAVFGTWSDAEVAAVPPSGTADRLPAPQGTAPRLAPGALALFLTGWSSLHGVVVLELLGHLRWTGVAGEQTARAVLEQYADHVEAVRARLTPAGAHG